MNKKVILIVLCVVFVVLLCGSAVLYERLANDYNNSGEMNTVDNDTVVSEQNESPEKNEEQHEDNINVAPDVEVYDKDGNSIMLSSFYNKPVVLNFWATWCGPCQMIAPTIHEISEEREDIVVGKVNVDEEMQLAMQFGISSIPTLLLFKDGKLVNQAVGLLPKASVLKFIDG